MASDARTELPESLLEFMQAPRITQITTLDHESKGPFVNVISWVLARDAQTVRLMGDGRTRFVQNLKADPQVALTVLGAGSAWTVYGRARILAEKTPDVPLSLAMVEVTDLKAYEVMFWGAKLTQVPEWDVTYSREQSEKLDAAVFAAMRTFA